MRIDNALEFICRVREGRRWQLGKIRSPIEGCKLSINRRAKNFRTFEVLVEYAKTSLTETPCACAYF